MAKPGDIVFLRGEVPARVVRLACASEWKLPAEPVYVIRYTDGRLAPAYPWECAAAEDVL